MRDFLTIARTPLWMAKRYRPGRVEQYSQAKFFDFSSARVADLDELAGLLAQLIQDPRRAVLRGELIDASRPLHVRRLLHGEGVAVGMTLVPYIVLRRGSFPQYVKTLASLPPLMTFVSVSNAPSILKTLFGRREHFKRTPKTKAPTRA